MDAPRTTSHPRQARQRAHTLLGGRPQYVNLFTPKDQPLQANFASAALALPKGFICPLLTYNSLENPKLIPEPRCLARLTSRSSFVSEMNRHHYALFVRNCRLILLLRRDFSEGDLNIFRPAEWRWKLPQVSLRCVQFSPFNFTTVFCLGLRRPVASLRRQRAFPRRRIIRRRSNIPVGEKESRSHRRLAFTSH